MTNSELMLLGATAPKRTGSGPLSRAKRIKNLSGMVVGRLSVVGLVEVRGRRYYWGCNCSCGNTAVVIGSRLTDTENSTKSCGCLHRERFNHFKHGQIRSGAYITWCAMKQRCYNPAHRFFKNYGGNGIVICERWKNDFREFLKDMGERPVGYTIDRIDNDGNYEPGNCRWATPAEQSRNTRRQKRNKAS